MDCQPQIVFLLSGHVSKTWFSYTELNKYDLTYLLLILSSRTDVPNSGLRTTTGLLYFCSLILYFVLYSICFSNPLNYLKLSVLWNIYYLYPQYVVFWLLKSTLWYSGPAHYSSGGPLETTVVTRLSLSWSANSFWIQLSGPNHPSSGASIKPMVGTRSSLFWCISEDQGRDQIIPLLVHL